MPDKTNDSKEKAHPTRIFQPVAAYQSGTYVTQQVADGLKSQNALMPVISLPLHPTGAREAVSNYLIQRKEDPLSAKSETDLTLAEVQPANHTNLPDGLKTAVEALSGVSLENVRVHYNSSLPAQVNALAYTRGHRIFIAPDRKSVV